MDFPANKRSRGFTVVELLISMAIAGLIGGGLATLTYYLFRSSSVVVNYAAVNARDRVSLEILGRDIRAAEGFTSLSPSNVTLLVSGQTVNFSFNEQEGRLYRTVGNTSQVLLPNCDSLLFEFRERNPVAGNFEGHLVSTSAACRIIQMTWSSSIASDPKTKEPSTIVNTAKYLNRRRL